MVKKYPLEANGLDITNLVQADSYETALVPVYGETIITMDGIERTCVIRKRGEVSFEVNPQTASAAAALCEALLKYPVKMRYHCLQRNTEVLADMKLSSVSARHLSRVRFAGCEWNEIGKITLTEL